MWNDRPAQEVRAVDGRVLLRADGYAPGALAKTPEVEGPIGEVVNTPFAIVVGTASADPKMRDACRAHADRLIARWKDWQRVTPRVFEDTQMSDADFARYSLVLIGGA